MHNYIQFRRKEGDDGHDLILETTRPSIEDKVGQKEEILKALEGYYEAKSNKDAKDHSDRWFGHATISQLKKCFYRFDLMVYSRQMLKVLSLNRNSVFNVS